MVTLIDQRILIDAPPQIVWQVIADPSRLSDWHTGYTAVSVLSTSPTGVGSRRRCTLKNGKDLIEENTAWLDGLGYEYTIVDGSPYRSFQGRIRLQASPEGTSVQWTVTYKPKGLFRSVRNRLRGRSEMANLMATSLRRLRQQVDALGLRMGDTDRAKVAIRERLNADERAQYQRRFPPPEAVEAALQAPITPPGATPVVVPPAERGIQPGLNRTTPPGAIPAVSSPVEASASPVTDNAPVPPAPIPSFVADLTAEPVEPDYSHKADTKPKAPPGLKEAIAAQQAAAVSPPVIAPPPVITPPPGSVPPAAAPAENVPAAPAVESVPESSRPTPPRGIPSVRPSGSTTPAGPDSPSELPAAPARVLPPPTPVHDTGEISIWEAFGVKRPSEQTQAVLDDLVRTVQSKRIAALRRYGGIPKRPVRVRHVEVVMGLRQRQALQKARVRLRKTIFSQDES